MPIHIRRISTRLVPGPVLPLLGQVQHVLVKGERRSCGTPPFSGTAWSCQAWHGLTRRQLVARAGQSLQFVAADAGWHIDGVHRLVDFGLAIRRARPIAGFESFLAAAAIVAIRPHELDADVRRHLPPIVTTRVRPACSVTDCGASGLSMGLPEPTEVALPLSSNARHQLSSFRQYLPAIGWKSPLPSAVRTSVRLMSLVGLADDAPPSAPALLPGYLTSASGSSPQSRSMETVR